MPRTQKSPSRQPSLEERAIQNTQLTVNLYTTEIERRLGEVSKMCDEVRFNLQLLRRLSIKRK